MEINIACNLDDNYAQHCCVMLKSLFSNNRNINFNIFIITQGLNKENAKILADEVSQNHSNIEYIKSSDEVFHNLPSFKTEGKHPSYTAYLRLFLLSLLPINIDKVLYLDCDLLIVSDITGLYNTNISEYPLAAVPDSTSYITNDNYTRLKYDKKYSYFNSGVLLINLKYWRDHNCENIFNNYINNNRSNIVYHDQDILNGVFYKNWYKLPIRCNVLHQYYCKYFYNMLSMSESKKEEIKQEVENAKIIHFCSSEKPWLYYCSHPYSYLYYKYLSRTSFSNFHPKFNLNKRIATNIIINILTKLKLKDNIYIIHPRKNYL